MSRLMSSTFGKYFGVSAAAAWKPFIWLSRAYIKNEARDIFWKKAITKFGQKVFLKSETLRV